nr:MAG: hypothetical protein TU36_07020 [Vulcanisaeta sp. AZ3]
MVGVLLGEVWRVLRVGGLFVVTVWGCTEYLVRRMRLIGDCEGYLPWSYGISGRVERYYRLYRGDELAREVVGVGFEVINQGAIRVGRHYDNYYIVSTKMKL